MNVYELAPGDEVYWNDPDDGACSRIYKIATVEVRDEGDDTLIVRLTDKDGSALECYAEELT